jgi:hypothetical protein
VRPLTSGFLALNHNDALFVLKEPRYGLRGKAGQFRNLFNRVNILAHTFLILPLFNQKFFALNILTIALGWLIARLRKFMVGY